MTANGPTRTSSGEGGAGGVNGRRSGGTAGNERPRPRSVLDAGQFGRQTGRTQEPGVVARRFSGWRFVREGRVGGSFPVDEPRRRPPGPSAGPFATDQPESPSWEGPIRSTSSTRQPRGPAARIVRRRPGPARSDSRSSSPGANGTTPRRIVVHGGDMVVDGGARSGAWGKGGHRHRVRHHPEHRGAPATTCTPARSSDATNEYVMPGPHRDGTAHLDDGFYGENNFGRVCVAGPYGITQACGIFPVDSTPLCRTLNNGEAFDAGAPSRGPARVFPRGGDPFRRRGRVYYPGRRVGDLGRAARNVSSESRRQPLGVDFFKTYVSPCRTRLAENGSSSSPTRQNRGR